jgi:mRNA interferase MazF
MVVLIKIVTVMIGWGCAKVSGTTRIMISLPKKLLQEVDGIVEKENSNRSEVIRQAMRLYLQERKKRVIREMMQRGYMEMARINLNISHEAFEAEEEAEDGSEQGGVRPVLIIQNDIGNRFSPTVIVAAITAQIQKAKLPTHVEISAKDYGFDRDSVILLEQIRTIDKQRLTDKITHLDDEMMGKVNEALQISLGLIDF